MGKLYMIGNAHLDPVWMWRWQEGYTEVLQTFKSALDRMGEFPDFKFTSACSLYYAWIEENDPEMFAEIKKRVSEGRWNIVGGWLLQPDCNIPSGESFARHSLFAQRYFKEKFGITVKTGYNVDSFGHNAGLPKILKASGMDNYVYMRPDRNEMEQKDSLFKWEGDDGSFVTAFRVPLCYNVEMKNFENFEKIKKLSDEEDIDYMLFYGVGNHGGGPTIELINEIEKVKPCDAIYSTPDEYFECVDKSNLTALKGDLQHHARGCYSAETSVKAGNRKCEQNLLAAERFSAMAKELANVDYPQAELNKAWKNVLFNQFHDILGGCSIKSAYKDADYLYGETMAITEKVINKALQKIAWNIDTIGDEELPSYKNKRMRIWEHEKLGTPVVVFNSHPFPVTEVVQVYTYNKWATYITDDEGNVIPHQFIRGEQTNSDDRYITTFVATVPALGYRVYRFFLEKETDATFEKQLFITKQSLENSKIKVEFDKRTGEISKIYDKAKGKYITHKPFGTAILDETHCDTWAHGEKILGKTVGKFAKPRFEILNDGDVLVTLRITSKYKNSTLVRDYTLIPESNRVTVKARVDFREKHRAFKLTFPATDEVLAKTAYGTIAKKLGTGEEPCGEWIASGNLCVANDSKYGYDTTDTEMRLSILRTAIYCDHFGERDDFCEYMDLGVHEFSYSVFPYTDNATSERVAQELNFGLRTVMGTFKKGTLPEKYQGLETDESGAVITTIKKCEDGEENLVRVCEMNGNDEEFSLKLFGKEIKIKLSHNEFKTLTESGKEINLIEF